VRVKYALDSNLFIDAFRGVDEEALADFHARFAPFEYLSAVVALELRAGTRTKPAAARLREHVLSPFERSGRVFAPGYPTWKQAGAALAALGDATRAFYNDVLIAASCREHGVTLVTRNVRDFERIRAVLPFDFVAAWP
jgi:predicted nucleic acid-binding protein